jgi:arylsulfatase A-like enzyme
MTVRVDDPENLVLITVDSLRADHCGFVNSESNLTPEIDRLAKEGVAFNQAIAPGPRTPSSVPVMFTGEFMSDDPGWQMSDWGRRRKRIANHMFRFYHISERMHRYGYETAAFTANPWTTEDSNFHYGFDDFNEISANNDDLSSKFLSDSTFFRYIDEFLEAFPGDVYGWSNKKEWFSQWSGYFELIEDKIERLEEPFFLWVFILDTHQPYITPRQFREETSVWEMFYSTLRYWHSDTIAVSPYLKRKISKSYRDAVRSVDAFIEAMYQAISPYDPISVFLSDHGEALGEHEAYGHNMTLYEENLHVPCFIHNAGVKSTVKQQVSLSNVPELFHNLVEPDDFRPKTYHEPLILAKTENNAKTAIRMSNWKFISEPCDHRLYDLESDPGEQFDISDEREQLVSAFLNILKHHRITQHEKKCISSAVELSFAGKRI